VSFFISTITMKVLKLAVSLLRTINCSRHNKNLYFVYLVLFHLLVYSSILIWFLTRFTCINLFTCILTCLDLIFDTSFTCIILFTCVFTCLDLIFDKIYLYYFIYLCIHMPWFYFWHKFYYFIYLCIHMPWFYFWQDLLVLFYLLVYLHALILFLT
jgi:hypothetical protein